jgi:16S rRNA (adenine1518-N6/adenine1519-N6)-dimethyltransferase
MYQNPKLAIGDEELFEKTLYSIFAKRRKTLLNALMTLRGKRKNEMAEICRSAGIDPMRRAETLTIEEFGKLYHHTLFVT